MRSGQTAPGAVLRLLRPGHFHQLIQRFNHCRLRPQCLAAIGQEERNLLDTLSCVDQAKSREQSVSTAPRNVTENDTV